MSYLNCIAWKGEGILPGKEERRGRLLDTGIGRGEGGEKLLKTLAIFIILLYFFFSSSVVIRVIRIPLIRILLLIYNCSDWSLVFYQQFSTLCTNHMTILCSKEAKGKRYIVKITQSLKSVPSV
ncbi:unnamed protein product [Cuscuta epithymum]|uniref:Uncharacterized protein n=1 Tax=Cuscuta epithymum TaxID=186058 RepID=A0AAV0DYQ0_9ASTE|nr:unnamed protein product [Cuscuta epithymum]